MLKPRTHRKLSKDLLLPFTDQVYPIGPVPQVSLDKVHDWINNAYLYSAKHLVIIFEHDPLDNIREVYPWHADTEWQMRCRVALLEKQHDVTVLQIIDLSKNIDSQLAQAEYIS